MRLDGLKRAYFVVFFFLDGWGQKTTKMVFIYWTTILNRLFCKIQPEIEGLLLWTLWAVKVFVLTIYTRFDCDFDSSNSNRTHVLSDELALFQAATGREWNIRVYNNLMIWFICTQLKCVLLLVFGCRLRRPVNYAQIHTHAKDSIEFCKRINRMRNILRPM